MDDFSSLSDLERGAAVIRGELPRLPDRPGVYRMLGRDGSVLYVGKARSLRKRVAAYPRVEQLSGRLQRMVSQIFSMEFTLTHTEVEALLLEANFIKSLRPPFNILLKDDKAYPYILLTNGEEQDFPRALKYRGPRKDPGTYFGPFASTQAVNRTLIALQKAFLLRNCTDSFFAARTRPCLQYQIKRCTAPCVGKVSVAEYAEQVAAALAFLSGESQSVQATFADRMQAASDALDFETAARYRDRIRALTQVQAHQDVNLLEIKDLDCVTVLRQGGVCGVQVVIYRGGQNYGTVSFFPTPGADESEAAVLSAFLPQYYADKDPPPDVLLSVLPEEADLLAQALSEKAGRRVSFSVPQRGARRRILDFAVTNTEESLNRYLAARASANAVLGQVATLFGLEVPPDRIEVYDNSHLGGTGMVGAMIVAGPEGFRKNAYRKFNIRTAGAADDYGMMREVMARRFSRTIEEGGGPGQTGWPDLLLIDGGAGQLHAVTQVLEEMGVAQDLVIVAISKGPDRNAGREMFHMTGRDPFQLPIHDPVLHYLQRLRDEAHRFAIGAQRGRRTASVSSSALDDIPGIGPARRRALLRHFGSARAVAAAGLPDLIKVSGVSEVVARRVYDFFHGS